MVDLMPLELVHRVEHLLLAPQLNRADIDEGCTLAVKFDCLAVVVMPHYIEHARKVLKETRVKVFSVIGFPNGAVSTAAKMYETQDILQRGAEEIEMVMNLGALRDHDDLAVRNDIQTVIKVARGHAVTVVIETALLSNDEKIRACKLAEAAGASALKTASDFNGGITVPEDVRLLRATCPNLPIKAAGGIASRQVAKAMLEAGAARIATRETHKLVE